MVFHHSRGLQGPRPGEYFSRWKNYRRPPSNSPLATAQKQAPCCASRLKKLQHIACFPSSAAVLYKHLCRRVGSPLVPEGEPIASKDAIFTILTLVRIFMLGHPFTTSLKPSKTLHFFILQGSKCSFTWCSEVLCPHRRPSRLDP